MQVQRPWRGHPAHPCACVQEEKINDSSKKRELIDRWKRQDTIILYRIETFHLNLFELLSTIGGMYGGDPRRPFGGIQVGRAAPAPLPYLYSQIIAIGDFYGMRPPVASSPTSKDSFVFQSNAWKQLEFVHLDMPVIHRQTDAEFRQVVYNLRTGPLSSVSEAFLQKRYVESKKRASGASTSSTPAGQFTVGLAANKRSRWATA